MRRLTCGIIVMALCISLATMPAGADDYILSIFGNANMDDTIGEDDLEYVQGIIEGSNDETEFADANYDGQIDEDDITQIELIISGEEKELTLVDQADRIVTVPMPIERVVTLFPSITRTILSLDGCDRLVGVSSTTTSGKYSNRMIMLQAYPELLDLSNTGSHKEPNVEQILTLEPDVIFSYGGHIEYCSPLQEKTGIPVVALYHNPNLPDGCFESYRLAGRVLGKEERAEDLISYMEEQFAELNEVTSQRHCSIT